MKAITKSQIFRSIEGADRKVITALRRQLAKAQFELSMIEAASFDRWLKFEVTLTSCWEDKGEKNVTTLHTGTLSDAILAAEVAFKKENNRGDVQATYTVTVVFSKKIRRPVNKKLWEHLTEKKRK